MASNNELKIEKCNKIFFLLQLTDTLRNLKILVPLCRHVSRGLVAKSLPPGENHLTYRQSDRADSSLIQTQLRFLFSPSIVFSENKRSH